jgi:hypothetical protein
MTLATGPEEWEWWWGKWRDRIRCGTCRALMDFKAPCPVCGCDYSNLSPTEHLIDGKLIIVPSTFMGALDWSSYVMLQLMEREWLRPVPTEGKWSALPKGNTPSSRVLLVLVFWTYFESLMGWFYETATNGLPGTVGPDLLRRYSFIGARLDRVHKILFGATYRDDLEQLGFGTIWHHLANVQQQRNAFMHGNPEAITDSLVEDTARFIPEFHEAWIASFNMRCAKRA